MNHFSSPQYPIERPEPSELFLRARNYAGRYLQEQFRQYNTKVVQSSRDGFKWLKAELTYPAFDHFSFAYHNDIFSVLVDLHEDSCSLLTPQEKIRHIKACEANRLIPCLFAINHNRPLHNEDRASINRRQVDPDFSPRASHWNLTDARTNEQLDPLLVASMEPTLMSPWELNNFAIQIVCNYIEQEGDMVLSFCDLLDVNPQVWFKNIKGQISWVLVKHVQSEREKDYKHWLGLEQTNPQLMNYDGFFASVQFLSNDAPNPNDLFRGDSMSIDFKGLERIYVV